MGGSMNENVLSIKEDTDRNIKKRTLKITRDKLDYLLQIEEDGVIVHETHMKDIDSMKEQFEGIAEEVSLYWQDKNGVMNIRLNSNEFQTEVIQFVNYASYPKDVVFKTTLDAIQKKEKSSSKVISEKEATEILIRRIKKSMIGATMLGTSFLLYALHLDSDTDINLVVEKIPYESEVGTEDEEIELISEEKEVVMNSMSGLGLSNETTDLETDMIYLYNQPLLSNDLNIYMYQIAQKYHVPYQSLISIAHVESDGNFNNHGKIGCSGDQGVMQINPSNYPVLLESLGYTPDQIQNDDRINIECAAFLLKDMYDRNVKRNGQINMDELYREYNGGINFKDIPATEDYLAKIRRATNTFYNDSNLFCVEVPTLGVSK